MNLYSELKIQKNNFFFLIFVIWCAWLILIWKNKFVLSVSVEKPIYLWWKAFFRLFLQSLIMLDFGYNGSMYIFFFVVFLLLNFFLIFLIQSMICSSLSCARLYPPPHPNYVINLLIMINYMPCNWWGWWLWQ